MTMLIHDVQMQHFSISVALLKEEDGVIFATFPLTVYRAWE